MRHDTLSPSTNHAPNWMSKAKEPGSVFRVGADLLFIRGPFTLESTFTPLLTSPASEKSSLCDCSSTCGMIWRWKCRFCKHATTHIVKVDGCMSKEHFKLRLHDPEADHVVLGHIIDAKFDPHFSVLVDFAFCGWKNFQNFLNCSNMFGRDFI